MCSSDLMVHDLSLGAPKAAVAEHLGQHTLRIAADGWLGGQWRGCGAGLRSVGHGCWTFGWHGEGAFGATDGQGGRAPQAGVSCGLAIARVSPTMAAMAESPSSAFAPSNANRPPEAPRTLSGSHAASTAWLFLAPALVLLAISVLIPGAMALVISFTRSGLDVTEPLRFVGLANFRRLLADPMLLRVAFTTLLYLIGVVPPILAGSLALAVLVNRQLPAIAWFRAAFYTPVLVSLVVAAIAFRWLYAENGLINGWLGALFGPGGWLAALGGGGAFRPIGFLTSPWLALPAVMLVTLWKGLGYYMVIFLGGLQGIAPELYEAAALDGSTGLRRHLDITLPLLRP